MSISVSKFTVSEDCYPRYVFMKKKVHVIMNRVRNIWTTFGLKCESETPATIVNEANDKVVIYTVQSIMGQIIGKHDILKRNATCERKKAELNDDLVKYILRKRTKYIFPETAFIIIQQTIGQNKFTHGMAVVICQADKDMLSKMLRKQGKINVCLRESLGDEICKVLERNAFNGLKEQCEEIDLLLKYHVFGELEETAQCLVYDMIGLYNRSQVPENERPQIAVEERNKISAKLLTDLKVLSEKISWCGFDNSTLFVFVDEQTPTMFLRERIGEVLMKHEISKFKIESSLIKPLAACPSGSKVLPDRNKTSRFGTLAGYVRSDENETVHALISRHVAKQSCDGRVHISNGSCSVKGKIRTKINHEEQRYTEGETMGPVLDVAAARIKRKLESKCDFTYKTKGKVPVPGIMCEYEPHQLQGLEVHHWGATISPGIGKLAIPDLKSVQGTGENSSLIIVTDRNIDDEGDNQAAAVRLFCDEGDSGSMVLTDDPDTNGEKVQLISMVVGKILGENRLYTTVKLKAGLTQIENDIGERLSLC